MTAIRRLAAILAADVVGYSRLMGADEEGTLERLKALRRELVDPKIAEHHGRIVKTTGDACSWNLRAWWMLSAARSRCNRRRRDQPPGRELLILLIRMIPLTDKTVKQIQPLILLAGEPGQQREVIRPELRPVRRRHVPCGGALPSR
jgi:hypothetical protein